MKSVLITGGAGFIGYNLSKQLIKNKYEVDIVDNLSIGVEAKIFEGCNFLGGDVIDFTKIKDKNYDIIYHLAALSRIQPSFKNTTQTFLVNTYGTIQVLDYALKNKCKLIYAGSSSKHHNPKLSPYAMSKYLGEESCKMYKELFGLNVEIVRFYNVYGEGELVDSKMSALLGIFRNQIKKNEPLTIYGDGEQRRDFTHIIDIVDGLIKIGESEQKQDDAWELGTGCNYSINEVFEMFNQKYNGKLKKVYLDDVKGNYRETIRINDDAIKILNWKPKDRLKEYIQNL